MAAGAPSCRRYSAHESEPRRASVPASIAAASAVIADEGRGERAELLERHGQPLPQLTARAPAHRGRRAVGAAREPVARELGAHLGVLGRIPRAADLDERARAREGPRPGPASQAVPALEHEHRGARVGQVAGGAQAGEPGSGDNHVGVVAHARSGARSSQSVTPQVIASQTQSDPRTAPW